MSLFSDIADQWQVADNAFGALEQAAFAADDDATFDTASEQRIRNDQAYFLFLFTRFESSVNQAASVVVGNRTTGVSWSERRVWEAWSKRSIDDVHFMSKVEVLIDKSLNDYGTVRRYYDGRNDIAHGGIWSEQFLIPKIAQIMADISASFPTS